MPSFERPHALFRRSEADEYVRTQPEPRRVATLNVPARGDIDGHDGDVGVCEERKRDVEWGAQGRLEGKAEDRVEHDVARRERGRERALRLRGVRRRERRDVHVRTLLVQALHHAVSKRKSSVR